MKNRRSIPALALACCLWSLLVAPSLEGLSPKDPPSVRHSRGGILSESVSPAKAGWRPEATWVFVVGVLEWRDAENLKPFPKKNRRDQQLVETFKRSGVGQDRIVFLKDQAATQNRIDAEFSAFLGRIPAGDSLFIYFCGHGAKSEDGRDVFFCGNDFGLKGENGWSVRKLLKRLSSRTTTGVTVVFADCCYSGFLAEALAELQTSVPIAVCSSSSASEVSTEHWTFTEAILSALAGAPWADLDGDGRVTLDEFAEVAHHDMGRFEGQRATIEVSKGFPKPFVLATGNGGAKPPVGERLEANVDESWWKCRVIEARSKQIKVHYIGYDDEDDQWIDHAATRPIAVKHFPVGSKVQVEWEGKWFAARVLSEEDGVHEIAYDGYGKEWNEWVAPSRIRKTPPGK